MRESTVRPSRLLPIAGLAIAAIGFSSGAQAACTFTGKGAACRGDISAMAMVVTDPNWRAKWNTSVETTPRLTTSNKLGNGDKATLLTFFSVERGRMVELNCDLKVKLPNGEVQKHPAQLCFKGKLTAGNIYMTRMEIGLEGDGEQGKAEFNIGIVDKASGTRLPLKTIVEFTK